MPRRSGENQFRLDVAQVSSWRENWPSPYHNRQHRRVAVHAGGLAGTLPGLQIEVQQRPPAQPHYLIDGVMATLNQIRSRYCIATWSENGKTCKRYFGIADPREKYPLVEKVEAQAQ